MDLTTCLHALRSVVLGGLLIFYSPCFFAQEKYVFSMGSLDSIQSDILKENRKFWIQLPEYYSPKRSYPVVYVLDGAVHLNAVSVMHSYYSGGFIPEMILVGVSNQQHRNRDLTPSKLMDGPQLSYINESGGAEKFTQFLADELIPYIEKKYPVTSYRTLIGHSYGGLFTIHTLLHHQELFANYLAIDPSLDWDGQKLIKNAKLLLEKERFDGKSLFISLSGQLHLQDATVTIDNVMKDSTDFTLFPRSILTFTKEAEAHKSNGLITHWKFYPNDPHGTVSFPSIMDGLLTLFSWFPIEHTDQFNNPETPLATIKELVAHRAKKLSNHLGYEVPPFDEELFTMLGYMNMDMGMLEKSLAFFQYAIHYFPNSANAFESIADYYITTNGYKMALTYLEKACDLSQEEQRIVKKIDALKNKVNRD
ncbi:alpha/beta hydrolase-fold protein [Flavobacteriaceae bacterium F08102]|nr:alpha/beta hydrolase-fold protein [Flavobacteriaceae bacterium F08102]